MLVGYARVSSAGQSLEVQREQLQAAGCEKIFEEKMSGRNASDRPALNDALEWVREGDTLAVTRVDRLARSALDLKLIIAQLSAKKVGFKALQQAALDTDSSTGKLVLGILGEIAEFEADLRAERQREGQAKARAEGRQFGRPKSAHEDAIKEALRAGESPMAIKKRLGVARSTVYRVKADLGAE